MKKNSGKQAVINFIGQHPGCSFQDIRRGTGLDSSVVNSSLWQMHRDGQVKREGECRSYRYYGAIEATKAGADIIRLECKDFVGSEADRIAFMVTRNQGKPLTALERATAYQRLRNQGWEPDEIAKKVKRSLSDVDYHLHLLTCGEELISMVRAGEVSPTTAVALSREHGPQAASVAVRQMDKARASGKSKLTRSAALPQFSAAKARQFLQIVADQADIELPADARAILDNYREFLKEAGWESEA